MRPPDRLTVPTCIGCGAMGRTPTCEADCSEQKLELVRAAADEQLVRLAAAARACIEAFGPVAEKLRSPFEDETRYRALQQQARDALHLHPDDSAAQVDWDAPSEPVTTWWCPECGGLEAPQPCLGICIWRPVEWVRLDVYESHREAALAERDWERRLRQLLRSVAWVTPRPDQWQRGWDLLRSQAQACLERREPSSAPRAGGPGG
jgi:hypothetical protein